MNTQINWDVIETEIAKLNLCKASIEAAKTIVIRPNESKCRLDFEQEINGYKIKMSMEPVNG